MDIRNISSDIDLKLNLLCGDEMSTLALKVKPLTLREIKDVKYSEYAKYLSILTIDKKEVTNNDPKYDGVSLIDIVVESKDTLLLDAFADAMCIFLREDKSSLVINDMGFIFGALDFDRDQDEVNIVNGKNFADFVQIIKYQNCLVDTNVIYSVPNPADEKTQRILDKIKQGKEIVDKVKSKSTSGNNIDISDIISAVSTKSNTYNKSNVWDLTLYQLYDEYKRLETISSYEINIAAMLQGVKVDDLKHWSSKND